jgi:hypothetical protein
MPWDTNGAQDAVFILNLVGLAVLVVIILYEPKREIDKSLSNLNKQRIYYIIRKFI